jgi:hypothetical protein
MYRTIKRRFEVGNIKLVTAINTAGTIITLFISLWIFSFVSEIKLETNLENMASQVSQELLRGVSTHGFISSIASTLYLFRNQNEKLYLYYLFLSIGSIWLLFTTKSIWPSLLLGLMIGPFLPQKDYLLLSSTKCSTNYPDL